MNDDLTADDVRSIFDYDPAIGVLLWKRRKSMGDPKVDSWNTRFAGKPAGSNNAGYLNVSVRGRNYRAHRLIWVYIYGCWPDLDIDHIDGDRRNNKLTNLRQATRAENHQNIGLRPTNTSGLPGAFYHKKDGKWWSMIKANGKQVYLGTYPTKEAAHIAYVEAKKLLHEFSPTIRGFTKSSSR